MSQVDIVLDMLIASLKDEPTNSEDSKAVQATNEFLSYKLNWQQAHSLNSNILGNVLFKIFRGNINIRKQNNDYKLGTEEPHDEPVKGVRFHNKIINIWKNALNKHKYNISKCNINHNELLHLKTAELKNFIQEHGLKKEENINQNIKPEKENNITNHETKSDIFYGSEKRQDLHLFFRSIVESAKEFNDEEILDLQIRILKFIRTIKGKRELKQNLKRYCTVSMNFQDPLIKMV